MSRWMELPGSLGERSEELVVRLRDHKDRSDLSLVALATRTGYSKSSWDRYLNGRSLPTSAALEAFAAACDTEPAPLLALRELAEGEGLSKAAEQPVDPEPTAEVPLRDRSPWRAVVVSSVLSSVLTAGAVVLALYVLAPWDGEAPAGVAATATEPTPYTGDPHPEFGPFVFKPGKDYPCTVKRGQNGKLAAGYSRTDSEHLEKNASRWAVVEAQCLLKHHGLDPGVADGSFGNNTLRAVQRVQTRGKVAVDGMVGPDTWKVLRS